MFAQRKFSPGMKVPNNSATSSAAYSSDRMRERRRVVLATTRRLIADCGIDGFSMRTLADRAGVSTPTLFNIYGTRENLVSQAVFDAFYVGSGENVTDAPENLRQLEAYIAWTGEQIIELGNYVDAIVASYFSRQPNNPIRIVLQKETEAPYARYLEAVKKRGNLSKNTSIPFVTRIIANQIFASMHEWSMDELSNAALPERLRLSVLYQIQAVLRCSELEEVTASLALPPGNEAVAMT